MGTIIHGGENVTESVKQFITTAFETHASLQSNLQSCKYKYNHLHNFYSQKARFVCNKNKLLSKNIKAGSAAYNFPV